MEKKVLGHIDCPTCGTAAGMRITHDRNEAPFGYCEATCSQQLRIGGNPHRVAQFVARYPWAAKPKTASEAAPVPAPAKVAAKPAPAPVPAVTATAPAPAPEPQPEATPAPKSGFTVALHLLGITP